MNMFTGHLFRASRIPWRALGIWAAAALLLDATAPAQAIPKDASVAPQGSAILRGDFPKIVRAIDPFIPAPALPSSPPGDPDEVIRAIEAFPDVVVFPIRVAGPAVATTTASRLTANKIAQAAAGGSIAVIYPDIGEPYRSVFSQIIDGIEDKIKSRTNNIAVGPNVNVNALNDTLRRQDTRVVIALGREGVKVASALDSNIGVVVGGVLAVPQIDIRNLQVNSLSPDPALLFARLKELMPRVRRVYTVYNPAQNAWMLRLAKEAASAQGLELIAYEARDLRSAMRTYQDVFAAADASRDALWLPQDSTTVEESSVLPFVLQESWSHNLAVFSSSFGHVRRGVLFSLYPNNVELGRHLAGSALGYLETGEEVSGMVPLREVLMAVNLRTAKHLGLSASRQGGFDMAFPEQ